MEAQAPCSRTVASATRSAHGRCSGEECRGSVFLLPGRRSSPSETGDFWDGPVELADFSSARIQDFFHDSAYRAVVPSPRRARGPESIISYWPIKPGPLIEIGRTDGLVAIRANLWLYGDTLGGEFEPKHRRRRQFSAARTVRHGRPYRLRGIVSRWTPRRRTANFALSQTGAHGPCQCD